jgi:hypothetical protein
VQREEAIEIDGPLSRAWTRNRDRRAKRVVVGLAVRHHHVQAVDGAALKDRDEELSARSRAFGGAREERRREAERHHRHSARLDEDATREHGNPQSLIGRSLIIDYLLIADW